MFDGVRSFVGVRQLVCASLPARPMVPFSVPKNRGDGYLAFTASAVVLRKLGVQGHPVSFLQYAKAGWAMSRDTCFILSPHYPIQHPREQDDAGDECCETDCMGVFMGTMHWWTL